MFRNNEAVTKKVLLKIRCVAFLMMKYVRNKIIISRQSYHYFIVLITFCILYYSIFLLLPSPAFSLQKLPFVNPLDGEFIVKFREVYWDEIDKVERKHTGVDISGEDGDKVMASGNGVVSYIGFSPIGGRTIVIKHNEKIRTTYLNLLQIFVPVGAKVNQGDVIAAIGADDDPSSKIPHLHFGIIYDGKYLDPEDVLQIDYRNISKFIYLRYLKPDYKVELD